MTGANLAGTPVWAAALCAAACQTWRSVGEWLSTPKWKTKPAKQMAA